MNGDVKFLKPAVETRFNGVVLNNKRGLLENHGVI